MTNGGCRSMLAVTWTLALLALLPGTANPQMLASARAHIYPPVAAAPQQIHAALQEARRTHKRIILDFGGDWCGDCQVLNIYFHQSPNAELLQKYFVLVDVNIGNMDANLAIAHRYGVPVTGVPALAVLSPYGKVLYAQSNEFADMRNMEPSAVTAFLNKWKP
ncbi:MAG: thioredoxin family protein [Acidobacteriaceae bacterium]